MDQNIAAKWTMTERIIFRLAFCYLVFYFVFLDNFFVPFFPFLKYLHAPFEFVSSIFVGSINRLFVHNHYDKDIYTGITDSSWFGISMASYLALSILITIVWTSLDKRKNYTKLFTFLHVYARYYLAFVLFLYGIDKLLEAQFPDPLPDWLSQPTGNLDPHTLLWLFMGSSKSYSIFGGCVEVLAGGLLLFRKSSSLGALISIAVLTNILVIDIAYDTLVKALLFHLILISAFILSPNIKRIFNFFVSNKTTGLTTMPSLFPRNKYLWVYYFTKFTLVICLISFHVKNVSESVETRKRSYYSGIDGVYDIKEYYRNGVQLLPLTTDTARWKRIIINKYDEISVQFMSDSFVQYTIQPDSITKSLTLSLWNDSTFKSKLNYELDKNGNYIFEGVYKNDSIKFLSKKVDIQNYPLLKDKGKIKWIFW